MASNNHSPVNVSVGIPHPTEKDKEILYEFTWIVEPFRLGHNLTAYVFMVINQNADTGLPNYFSMVTCKPIVGEIDWDEDFQTLEYAAENQTAAQIKSKLETAIKQKMHTLPNKGKFEFE